MLYSRISSTTNFNSVFFSLRHKNTLVEPQKMYTQEERFSEKKPKHKIKFYTYLYTKRELLHRHDHPP